MAVQSGRKNKDLVPARAVAITGALGPSARQWCKVCGQRHGILQHSVEKVMDALFPKAEEPPRRARRAKERDAEGS